MRVRTDTEPGYNKIYKTTNKILIWYSLVHFTALSRVHCVHDGYEMYRKMEAISRLIMIRRPKIAIRAMIFLKISLYLMASGFRGTLVQRCPLYVYVVLFYSTCVCVCFYLKHAMDRYSRMNEKC